MGAADAELGIDRDRYGSAFDSSVLPMVRAIRQYEDSMARRLVTGDALIAAFNEGVRFGTAELLAQLVQQGMQLDMHAFSFDLDAAVWVDKYGDGTFGGNTPKPEETE